MIHAASDVADVHSIERRGWGQVGRFDKLGVRTKRTAMKVEVFEAVFEAELAFFGASKCVYF